MFDRCITEGSLCHGNFPSIGRHGKDPVEETGLPGTQLLWRVGLRKAPVLESLTQDEPKGIPTKQRCSLVVPYVFLAKRET